MQEEYKKQCFIIINKYSGIIREVVKIIEEIDKPAIQIMLEAKLIEVTLSDEDKETAYSLITEHEDWLNDNKDMTDKDMVEQKMKELQDSLSPIMSKLYEDQGQGMPGSGGMPGAGGMPDMSGIDPEMMAKMAGQMGAGSEPTIDEVD